MFGGVPVEGMPVVAAVDRSDRARIVVEQAQRLGEAFDEPVHAVHVLTRKEFVSLQRTNVAQNRQAVPVERIREIAEEIAAETLEGAGVDAEPVGIVGEPAEEIVEYARETAADYVVVAGRKRSAVGKALFGSVGQSILIEAECPVVSIRSDEEE